MLLENEIKIGEVYAWDVDTMISSLHIGTYTVKLLSVDDGAGILESVESGEVFTSSLHHLTSIDRIKRMYDVYASTETEDSHTKWSRDRKIERMGRVLLSCDFVKGV